MLTDILCVSCLHNRHVHTSSFTCEEAWFLTQERYTDTWTRQETMLIIGAPCLESEWEQRQRQKAAVKSGSFPAACSLHRKSKRLFHPVRSDCDLSYCYQTNLSVGMPSPDVWIMTGQPIKTLHRSSNSDMNCRMNQHHISSQSRHILH